MFDSRKGVLSVVFCILIFCGCTRNTEDSSVRVPLKRYQYSQLHLGVQVRIVLYADNDTRAAEAATEAYAKIATLEDIFSSYRAHSELNRLSTHPANSSIAVSAPLFEVLSASKRISQETEGAFDITLAPLISLWREARTQQQLPTRATIQAAQRQTGWHHIQLIDSTQSVILKQSPLGLNMGGIAKGYILDAALQTLKGQGMPRAFIEAGGDIVVGDPPPEQPGWTVHIPDAPPDSPAALKAAALRNAAISTSGDTEQYVLINGKRYSHVIDPATGLGTTHRTMATVIAHQGVASDGYATALTVLPPSKRPSFLENHPELITFIRTVQD